MMESFVVGICLGCWPWFPPDPDPPEPPVPGPPMTITYTTFIPLDHLRLPNYYGLFGGAYTADNQLDFDPFSPEFRIQHTFAVAFGVGVVDLPIPFLPQIRLTAQSAWHDYPEAYTTSGNCVRKNCSSCPRYTIVLPTGPYEPPIVINQPQMYLGYCLKNNPPISQGPEGADDMETVVATTTSITTNVTKVRFRGAPVVGFVPNAPDFLAAAIDWDYTLTLTRVNENTITWNITGAHDKFPTHDIRMDGLLLYKYDPINNGQTGLALTAGTFGLGQQAVVLTGTQ